MHKAGVSSLPFSILSATFCALPGIGSLRKSQINKARIAPADWQRDIGGRTLIGNGTMHPVAQPPSAHAALPQALKNLHTLNTAAVTYGARLHVWRWGSRSKRVQAKTAPVDYSCMTLRLAVQPGAFWSSGFRFLACLKWRLALLICRALAEKRRIGKELIMALRAFYIAGLHLGD